MRAPETENPERGPGFVLPLRHGREPHDTARLMSRGKWCEWEICRGYGLNRGSKQTACGNYVNPSTCKRSWNTARNFPDALLSEIALWHLGHSRLCRGPQVCGLTTESTWPNLGFECWGKVMGILPFSVAQLCGRGGRTEVKMNRKGLRRETGPGEGGEAFETFSSLLFWVDSPWSQRVRSQEGLAPLEETGSQESPDRPRSLRLMPR